MGEINVYAADSLLKQAVDYDQQLQYIPAIEKYQRAKAYYEYCLVNCDITKKIREGINLNIGIIAGRLKDFEAAYLIPPQSNQNIPFQQAPIQPPMSYNQHCPPAPVNCGAPYYQQSPYVPADHPPYELQQRPSVIFYPKVEEIPMLPSAPCPSNNIPPNNNNNSNAQQKYNQPPQQQPPQKTPKQKKQTSPDPVKVKPPPKGEPKPTKSSASNDKIAAPKNETVRRKKSDDKGSSSSLGSESNQKSSHDKKRPVKKPPPIEDFEGDDDDDDGPIINNKKDQSKDRSKDKKISSKHSNESPNTKPKHSPSPPQPPPQPPQVQPQPEEQHHQEPQTKLISVSDYLIETKAFKKLSIIGRGGFGVVFKVQERKTKKYYAMKELFGEFTSIEDERSFFRELEMLILVDHPALMNFRGFSMMNSEKMRTPTIVIEFLEGQSLQEVIEKKKEFTITEKIIAIYGVAEAMRYLHEKFNIVHRDLKPANVLLNSQNEPVVGDFGLSKVMEKDSMRQTQAAGSPVYMAPELLQRKEYTKSIDVYAYGFLCFELLTGTMAFMNIKSMSELLKAVIIGKRPEIKKTMPDIFKKMIEVCWSPKSEDRPTFKDILTNFDEGKMKYPGVDEEMFAKYRAKMAKYRK